MLFREMMALRVLERHQVTLGRPGDSGTFSIHTSLESDHSKASLKERVTYIHQPEYVPYKYIYISIYIYIK